jgi:hypothetical protein
VWTPEPIPLLFCILIEHWNPLTCKSLCNGKPMASVYCKPSPIYTKIVEYWRLQSKHILTCIYLGWTTERSSPGRVKNFHFSMSSRPALGSTQPPVQWVPGVKRPGREADHSPPTSAEVKKIGSIHPFPHTPSWRSA